MFSLQTATQPVGSLSVPPLSLTGAGFYETPPPMVDDAEGAGGAAQNLVLASQHYRFPDGVRLGSLHAAMWVRRV